MKNLQLVLQKTCQDNIIIYLDFYEGPILTSYLRSVHFLQHLKSIFQHLIIEYQNLNELYILDTVKAA